MASRRGFEIKCSRDALTDDELAILEKYGEEFYRLTYGKRSPTTDAQSRFVKAARGHIAPTTKYEKAWCNYLCVLSESSGVNERPKRPKRRRLHVGMLVEHPKKLEWGPGKVVAVGDKRVTVVFRDAPTKKGHRKRKIFDVSLVQLSVAKIQTGEKLDNKYRASHCWQCQTDLDNRTHDTCWECGWIVCPCGACQQKCESTQEGRHT